MRDDDPQYPPLSELRVPAVLRRLVFALGGDLPERVLYRKGVRIRMFGPPPEVRVGKHTLADVTVRCSVRGRRLTIGSFCGLARTTVIIGERHNEGISLAPLRNRWMGEAEPVESFDITIGNDAFCGEDVIVMGRGALADGAFAAARALVTRPLPPYCIAVGSPAKVLRYRFSPEDIATLQEARWWELPTRVIRENLALLYSKNVSAVRDLVRQHLHR